MFTKRTAKVFMNLLLVVVFSFFSNSVLALEKTTLYIDSLQSEIYSELYKYSEFYRQDKEELEKIYKKIPLMLEEGKEFAKDDVKSSKIQFRSATQNLGTYGDILVSLLVDSGSAGLAGHAAIVSLDSSVTIESFDKNFSPIKKDGVQYYTNDWRIKKGSLLLRPKNATLSQYRKAAIYAEKQVGKPYNWFFFNKNRTDAFYCSQLVWRSWLEQGIDCEKGSIPNGAITPADLVNSSNTYLVEHID